MWSQIQIKAEHKNNTEISNINSTSEGIWEENKVNKRICIYLFAISMIYKKDSYSNSYIG